ncbi:phage tail assembly protein [Pelosinus fermentans]|jgi:1,4-dihydroxy-2-naphthoyl-CoA synthase|uniref:Mu-like prophage FluMu protein gp41 n=1 Tax=Pelosinus fermentans JBW45 TaxID=1192197 RepID=I9NL02_9FIRM|nr:phage tail assembly protein [Pelosinus fermentans]AJQ29021.1 Mu-like prophage FluMu protein gp41 [Pelosinus fermentans JBW45]
MENTKARVITFNKPFIFEEKEYTELNLDLEALTGKDLLEASREVRTIGETSPVVELSKSYYAVVGAKAAKVPIDLVLALPAKEFSQLTVEVQSFLFE